MSERLTISVAMGTYNGAVFLREQLESILAQTLHPDELVVCDDASTDGTLEILQEFRERAPFPVIIVENQRNIGFLRNFERAIGRCAGDIIMLADQDDVWHADKIQRFSEIFAIHPKCGYVFSNAELIDASGNFIGQDLWHTIHFNPSRRARFEDSSRQLEVLLEGSNFIYGTTLAFRGKFRTMLLPIDSASFDCAHDTWICLLLSTIGAYGVLVAECLIDYRQHGKQLAGAGHAQTVNDAVRKIRVDKGAYYLELAETYDQIIARLTTHEKTGADISMCLNVLSNKTRHYRARSRGASSSILIKFGIVLKEIVLGNYFKYARPFRNIIKDLIA